MRDILLRTPRLAIDRPTPGAIFTLISLYGPISPKETKSWISHKVDNATRLAWQVFYTSASVNAIVIGISIRITRNPKATSVKPILMSRGQITNLTLNRCDGVPVVYSLYYLSIWQQKRARGNSPNVPDTPRERAKSKSPDRRKRGAPDDDFFTNLRNDTPAIWFV